MICCVQGYRSGKERWVDPPDSGLHFSAPLVLWKKEKGDEMKVQIEWKGGRIQNGSLWLKRGRTHYQLWENWRHSIHEASASHTQNPAGMEVRCHFTCSSEREKHTKKLLVNDCYSSLAAIAVPFQIQTDASWDRQCDLHKDPNKLKPPTFPAVTHGGYTNRTAPNDVWVGYKCGSRHDTQQPRISHPLIPEPCGLFSKHNMWELKESLRLSWLTDSFRGPEDPHSVPLLQTGSGWYF